MKKTLSFTDTSPQIVKIGDTATSFTLICGNDNVATDLTKATSITAKLGNADGYLKSIEIDPTKLAEPWAGKITVKFTADLMTSLPAGNYYIEVWVVDSTGTSIYPSDGPIGFTITNNIQSANGSTITTITFDDFVNEMNEAVNKIENEKFVAESDRTDAFGTLYSTLGDINKTVTGSLGKKIQFSGADKATSTDSVNYEIDNYGVTTLTFNRTGNWVLLKSQLGDYSKIEGEHLTVILENTGTYTPQNFDILLSNTGDWSGSFKSIGSVVFENGVFKVEFDVTSDNLGFTPNGSVYLIVRNLGASDVSQDVSVKISASFIASSTYGNPNAFSLKALESARSMQSDNSTKSDFAKSSESAENVGIKTLINSISSSNSNVTCTQLNATDFKVSKDYSKDSQSFPKIFLEVDYDSIDDLDENFILKITDNNPTSSEGTKATANVFYILSDKNDWNSLWHPINFSEGTYNLKSLISSSDYSDYYNSAKKLYILVGFYSNLLSDSTTYGNMFFDINITARIENSAAISVATELSSSLQEKINSESQYVNEIVCWGDSLTAMGGWTNKLATLTSMDVQNGGTGGETVRTIVARQGADIMTVNNITIPADISTAVEVGTQSTGISTQFGYSATPLLQGGDNHVNPVKIGNIEGTLAWTGSSSSDTTGVWNFTRNAKGNATIIDRITPLRTYFDRTHNNPYLMIIFMGQNGGYTDNDDLVRMHKLMIEHSHAKNVLILGMHTGTASSRGDYETAMKNEFGRKFFSLRQYLAHPVYGTDGKTIKSCWGLDDAGLTATNDDLAKIEIGQVPLQLLLDGTHYTTATREVVGNAIYNYLVGLNLF
ncbi:hypothetical protein [Lactiplantibacillus plantarum]|uniref:hypothetical protein n=1 Tax=Lactiplantibacillus plantarum TaxID=1590 RepID=UPI001FB926C4|nr:hypothetical protein [Lactiplantibacillus plantarum]